MKQLLKSIYRALRSAVHRLRDLMLRPEPMFRSYLRLRGVRLPARARPDLPLISGVLKSRRQSEAALEQTKSLRLPRHPDDPKNWDTLTAVAQILAETNPQSQILDAGAELYSAFLPSLYAYGYRHLTGINLAFSHPVRRGPIRYEHGDITRTRFADAHFDAAACLSVLEHGVPLRRFFTEMHRVIKPGGLLVVSTDYWDTSVEIGGKTAFGAPIHVFNRYELTAAIEIARQCGWELDAVPDLACEERAVSWDYYGLEYTFVVLTMRRGTFPSATPSSTSSQILEPAHSILTTDH